VPGTLCTRSLFILCVLTTHIIRVCVCVCQGDGEYFKPRGFFGGIEYRHLSTAPPFSVHTLLMPCCCQGLTCHMGPPFIFWLPLEPVLEIWRIRAFFHKNPFHVSKIPNHIVQVKKRYKLILPPPPPPPPPRKHCLALVFFLIFPIL